MFTKRINLLEGNITTSIILLALPIFLGRVFQNLYNSVDSIIVGRYVGLTALAAVGASAMIADLVVGFFTGLSTGVGVLAARYYGAKDKIKVQDSIHTAITSTILIGLLLSISGIIFSGNLLEFINCPDDVFYEACLYLKIYFSGMVFTALYNVGSGILRAFGDSKNPFLYLVISSGINIVLDLIFVKFFYMGIAGVAIATVLSQFVSAVFVLLKMATIEEDYRLELRKLKIKFDMFKEMMIYGIPSGIQTSLTTLSILIVNSYTNTFGAAAIAGVSIANKIDKFMMVVTSSLGLALSTYVGQNIGAKKHERIFVGIRKTIQCGLVMWLLVGGLSFVFAEELSSLFTDSNEAIMVAVKMSRYLMASYFMYLIASLLNYSIRGFGKSLTSMNLQLIVMVGSRIAYCIVMMKISYKLVHVFECFVFSWIMYVLVMVPYFYFAIYRRYQKENVIG